MLVFVSSFSAVNIHSNRIGDAMLSILASSAVDHGFKPWSGQSKDYEIVLVESLLRPKKNMCVYCRMSKISRVGRSGLIFFFFFYYRQNRK